MNFFPMQEPPSGGLTRLRVRLDARPRHRSWWALPVVGAALLALALFMLRPRVEPLVPEPSTAAYALGLVRAPSAQVILASSAPMTALTEPTADVQIYEMLGDVTRVP